MSSLNPNDLLGDIPDDLVTHHLSLPPGTPIPDRFKPNLSAARAALQQHAEVWTKTTVNHVTIVSDVKVALGDSTILNSHTIAATFTAADVQRAASCGVSLGGAIDKMIRTYWSQDRPDDAMALHAMAAAAVEKIRQVTHDQLQQDYDGVHVLSHYSPGYPDWPLSDQATFLQSIEDPTHPVTVLESGGLTPSYSTLFLVGLGHTRELPLAEDIWTQTTRPYTKAARLPKRTLEKWATKRLTLIELDNNRVGATFDFDGNTCTNMGTNIALSYGLTIRRTDDALLEIEEATISPKPGEKGYESSCAYKENPALFLATINSDTPQVGHTTHHTLTNYLSASSSACLCTPEYRRHKWRLFLETLHHALGIDDTLT